MAPAPGRGSDPLCRPAPPRPCTPRTGRVPQCAPGDDLGLGAKQDNREPSSLPSNPTCGSWWIVQFQPSNHEPTSLSSNPTCGSWWIVQFQPTSREPISLSSRIPPAAAGGLFNSSLLRKRARPPVNAPTVAQTVSLRSRLPPTCPSTVALPR